VSGREIRKNFDRQQFMQQPSNKFRPDPLHVFEDETCQQTGTMRLLCKEQMKRQSGDTF
jgi:hypothetical protein